jgi:fibronectin-binding autotransporter adhesin
MMNKKTFCTKRAPDCREGRDKLGKAESNTLDYNGTRGWRGGPPPRQNNNWIPRVALLETIALALLVASGYAGGGFLRGPGMLSPSNRAAAGAGTAKAFGNAGLAIAWTINDVIAGAFHGSGGFQSAAVAGGETSNRHRAIPDARSSGSDSRPWTSRWLTLSHSTPSHGDGTNPIFRALADILSTHNSSKKPLTLGGSGSNRAIGSGAGTSHTTGRSAILATADAGAKVAGGANTSSEGTVVSGGGNTSGLVTNSLVSLAANADITSGNSATIAQAGLATTASAIQGVTAGSGGSGGAPLLAAAASGSASAGEDAERDWGSTGSDFNTNANWTAGTGGVAPGAGDVAWFKSSGSFLSPNLSTSKTISGIYFNGTGASGYNLTRTSTQTFTLTATGTSIGAETGDTNAVAIGAENTSGTNTIAVPITLAPASGTTSTIFQATGGKLVLSGVISGTNFGITKSGGGTLSLSGTNTYTGNTTVSQGILEVDANAPNNANGALGHTANAVTINDASTGSSNTALLIGTSGVTIGRAVTVANSGTGTTTLGGDITSGTGTFSGAVTLNKSANFNADGTSDITFSGAISGTGGITKTGAGTLVLNAVNTYTGSNCI